MSVMTTDGTGTADTTPLPRRIVARPVKVKVGQRWSWQFQCDNGVTYTCRGLARVLNLHETIIPIRIRKLGGYGKEGVLEPGTYQWPGADGGDDGARNNLPAKKVVLRPGDIFCSSVRRPATCPAVAGGKVFCRAASDGSTCGREMETLSMTGARFARGNSCRLVWSWSIPWRKLWVLKEKSARAGYAAK